MAVLAEKELAKIHDNLEKYNGWREIKVINNDGGFGEGTSSQCFWISMSHAIMAQMGFYVPARELKRIVQRDLGGRAAINGDTEMVDTGDHKEAIWSLAKILNVTIWIDVVGCNSDNKILIDTGGDKFGNGELTVKLINYNKSHFEYVAPKGLREINYEGKMLNAVPLTENYRVKNYIKTCRIELPVRP